VEARIAIAHSELEQDLVENEENCDDKVRLVSVARPRGDAQYREPTTRTADASPP
jgi:hypothetical protein